MRREGDALTSFDVSVGGAVLLNVTTPVVTCYDPARNFTVTGSPRRALLQAAANLYEPPVSTQLTVEHVYSTNGGTNWTVIPSTAVTQSLYAARVPPDERTVMVRGHLDLVVGTSYMFGLRVTASPATAGVGFYCAYQARVVNRSSASAPF